MAFDRWTIFREMQDEEARIAFIDDNGMSRSNILAALELAAADDMPELASYLLDQGVKPDAENALYTAISNNHVEVAERLLDHGAHVDIPNAVDDRLEQPPDEPITARDYADRLGRGDILALIDGPEQKEKAADASDTFTATNHKGFHKTTYGVVVAGREIVGLDIDRARALATECREWSETSDGSLVAIPAGDLVEYSSPVDSTSTPMLVGVEAASVDADRGGPIPVSRRAMTEALETARALPGQFWRDVAEIADLPSEQVLDGEIALGLTACGPLSLTQMMYGQAAEPETEVPEGLEFGIGHNSEQMTHVEGVVGTSVARASFDGRMIAELDLGDRAHEARVDAVAALDGDASYHIFAQYD